MMIKKMIAAVALAGGIALLTPSAALADDAFYSGPVYPYGTQCIRAWGNSAWAYGEAFPGVEFTVQFRPDGGSSFNLLDSRYDAPYFSGSYQRARTGTFKLCARNVRAFFVADVTLQLSATVVTNGTDPSASVDEGGSGDPTLGFQGMAVESGTSS